MKKYTILLSTGDCTVEAALKSEAHSSDCELNYVKSSRDVASMVMDGKLQYDFAVFDLDTNEGGRALLRTMGGALPVIAVTGKSNAWLSSMLRHRRVTAALTKPISPQILWNTFGHVRGAFVAGVARHEGCEVPAHRGC